MYQITRCHVSELHYFKHYEDSHRAQSIKAKCVLGTPWKPISEWRYGSIPSCPINKVGRGQCIANITAELRLCVAFGGPAEKAIELLGLIGNSMGIQAYSSEDLTKRRGRPGDTTKRTHGFGDTMTLIIKCSWSDTENAKRLIPLHITWNYFSIKSLPFCERASLFEDSQPLPVCPSSMSNI